MRGPVTGEPTRSRLTALIRGTYAEMPGLSLDLAQAGRLFGLREVTCRVVLEALVEAGHLRHCPDGRYRTIGSSV